MSVHNSVDLENVPGVVANLRHTFGSGRTRPLAWRISQLDGLLACLDKGEDEILDALAKDFGKPHTEAWLADIAATRGEIAHVRKHVGKWMRPRRAPLRMQDRPGRGYLLPEPLGVVLVIAPWNYPVNLLLAPLASVLAAGNCAVAKPSELTPHTSTVLCQLVRKYLDPEAVVVLEGGVDVSTALLEQRWDHIFFTGSTAVGKVVAQAAAKNLTPTTLELGGKSPVIVTRRSDVEVAARRIMFGKAFNAGQTCIAPDYVLVDDAVKDDLTDALSRAIIAFHGDNPAQSPAFTRIVNDHHLSRLAGLLEDHSGLVIHGGGVDHDQRRVELTLVVEPAPESALMQEEIFGPILPIIGYRELDDAIAFVNGRPKPLALYVFSKDKAEAERVLGQTSSGGAIVNHVILHFATTALPFGGVGESGMGAYHGRIGFDRMSHLKPVLRKPTKPDFSFMYPPYTDAKQKLFARILR